MPIPAETRSTALAFATLLAAATPASGADGVIEINEAKALAGGINGNLSTDPPNYPVTITQSGSYRLTGNLTVDEDTTAIVIAADDVAIDLAGFGIHGPNVCSGGTCSLSGTGVGIDSTSPVSGRRGLSVRNGVVEGMGGNGIEFNAVETAVSDVIVRSNGSNGIDAYNSLRALRLVAANNRLAGVVAQFDLQIASSQIYGNGTHGIQTSNWAVIAENVIRDNGGHGIFSLGHAVIRGNVVASNGVYGVFAYAGSVLAGNTITGSGLNGVSATVPVTLTGNQIYDNARCGVEFLSGAAGTTGSLGENSLIGNDTGGGCTGAGAQQQFQGYAMATTCNVITCTSGSLLLGTFCPPNTISCGLP